MQKFALLLTMLSCLSSAILAQCVVGVEANGPDQATIAAFDWRKTNVYDKIYAAKGFKVVLISQSSKAKLEAALNSNPVTHVTGCGHGSPTVYTGYSQATVLSSGDTTLLKKLAGKHVHLLSCLTAQQLGPAIIKNGGASFAGYHPSFYFTWKSTHRFFDADAELDRAFADGKNAPQAYKQTIDKFNQILEILKTEEPSAVQYIVIDRDGLRCLPARGEVDEEDFSLPLWMANEVLYGNHLDTKELVSYAGYSDSQGKAANYAQMSDLDFQQFLVNKFEKMDRDFELCILSHGKFHRDQIIEEIKRGTEFGLQMIAMEREFLESIESRGWYEEVVVKTDNNGNFSVSGKLHTPMKVKLKTIKFWWSNSSQNFRSCNLNVGNETLLSQQNVASNSKYYVNKYYSSGEYNYNFQGTGGPANSSIVVRFQFKR